MPGTKFPKVPNTCQRREHNSASWDQQDKTWVTKFLNFTRMQCHKDLNNTMYSQNWPFPLIKKPWKNLQLAKILQTTTEIAGSNYSPDKWNSIYHTASGSTKAGKRGWGSIRSPTGYEGLNIYMAKFKVCWKLNTWALKDFKARWGFASQSKETVKCLLLSNWLLRNM